MRVWVHAELECGPATVRDWMSFCGATEGARGQRGMHTFHGHEEDAGGDFDVGSTPHAFGRRSSTAGFDPRPRRAPSEPKLGR
jgi:hypothetical protein